MYHSSAIYLLFSKIQKRKEKSAICLFGNPINVSMVLCQSKAIFLMF